MTAAEIVLNIHSHGGQVTIDGSDLALTAPQPLPADLLGELRSDDIWDPVNNTTGPAAHNITPGPTDPNTYWCNLQVDGLITMRQVLQPNRY